MYETSLPSDTADVIDADLLDMLAIPLVFNDSIDTTNMANVVLIDSTLADKQIFYDSANANTFPIIYDYNSKTDDLLALFRQKFPASSIKRISLAFHDKGHNFMAAFMNNKPLFRESDLAENQTCFSDNVSFFVSCIKEFHISHIDFLACNTLQYSNWKSYYALLASKTSVVVGASNDRTGNLNYGGDWVMESTHENVCDLYFNASISNYASTLVLSTITLNGANGDVGLRMNGLVIEYYNTTTSTWTSIASGNWPVQFINSNLSSVLRVVFTQNLSITSGYGGTAGYFIAGSSYITFDGSNNFINITSITNYPGFIQNGSTATTTDGNDNVIVQNIKTNVSGGSLQNTPVGSRAGWICAGSFGRGALANQIINCSNNGIITNTSGGGICGERLGTLGGSVTITNCTNSGTIGNGAGGIVGGNAGFTGGSVTFVNCTNTGLISGSSAGGIAGQTAGSTAGSATFTGCANNGAISGTNAGGIAGSIAGSTAGSATFTGCTNTGLISGIAAGGIAGANAASTNGSVTFTGCTNTGNISGQYAGGITGVSGGFTNGLITLTNCFSTGTISGQYAGGIAGDGFAYDTSRNCVISQCYSTGNITGNNAGGIVGAVVGYTDIASIIPNVNITNSYSLGAISTTAGGICGGINGSIYAANPNITITNCYSFGSIVDANSGIVAIALLIPITKTNTYVANNTWSDATANSNLIGTPTNISTNNPGSTWTMITAGTPYVLSAYNAGLYSPSSASSTSSSSYTSAAGLFSPGYNYQLIYTSQTGNVITARVFASKGTAPYYNSYNSNTFTLSLLNGLYVPPVTIDQSTGALYFILAPSPTPTPTPQQPIRNVSMISGGGGSFWFGVDGFLYKRKGGGGGRRSTKMAPGGNTTCNGPTYIYNKYNPGNTGVGAQSTAVRRAKNIKAAVCGPKIPCGQFYNYLGLYDNYTGNPNGYVIYPRPNF